MGRKAPATGCGGWWPGPAACRCSASPRPSREQLAQLEERLAETVVGQEQAVKAVAGGHPPRAHRPAGGGPPHGGHAVLGPTGVGKTHLARALARHWFGTEKALVRFDMSEYMEAHAAAKLIGAPRAMWATARAGCSPRRCAAARMRWCCSTRSRRRTRTCRTCFLQILEDGQLTDSMGRKANFAIPLCC